MNGKQWRADNRDVSFSRDVIFDVVQEVNEWDKCKCSIILTGFDYNSVNDICNKFNEVRHRLNFGALEF